jgi:hypothetical protein
MHDLSDCDDEEYPQRVSLMQVDEDSNPRCTQDEDELGHLLSKDDGGNITK